MCDSSAAMVNLSILQGLQIEKLGLGNERVTYTDNYGATINPIEDYTMLSFSDSSYYKDFNFGAGISLINIAFDIRYLKEPLIEALAGLAGYIEPYKVIENAIKDYPKVALPLQPNTDREIVTREEIELDNKILSSVHTIISSEIISLLVSHSIKDIYGYNFNTDLTVMVIQTAAISNGV